MDWQVVLKTWLVLGMLTNIVVLLELPDQQDNFESFYLQSVVMLKSMVIWPWLWAKFIVNYWR